MYIPFDQPLMGPVRFDESKVPPVNVQLPPNLTYLIPRATALLLNRAGEMIQVNVGRLACFNALVIHNFQNPHLSEWVNIAIRIAFHKASVAGNPNSIEGYLNDAAGEALSYFSSLLTTRIPEIYQRVSPQAQGAASHNVSQFESFKHTIFNLNMSTIQNPIAGNYSHSYASAAQNQYGQPAQSTWNQPQVNMSQPVQPAWGQTTNVHNTNQSTWGQAPAPQQSVTQQAQWFNQEQSNYSAPAPEPEPVIKNTQQFFKAVEEPIVKNEKVQNMPVSPNPIAPPELKSTLAQGGHEMDINNHAIPYFGSSELLDLSNRRMDLKAEVVQITREGRRSENNTGPILLNNILGVEISTDTAIFMTRAAMRSVKNPEPVKIFRQFYTVLNPTICSEDHRGLMEILVKNISIYDLPLKFKGFVDRILDKTNPSEEEQQALNFMAFLDRKMAEATNTFLRYSMRITNVRLTSFSEGINALRETIVQHMGERYGQALDVWGSRFMSSLNTGYGEDAEGFLSGYFDNEVKGAIGYFPTNVGITLIDLTSKELDYSAEVVGTLIDPKITHVLYDLAAGLHRNKKDLGVFTNTDIIVTADDVRFIIGEDAIEPGRFYLFKT